MSFKKPNILRRSSNQTQTELATQEDQIRGYRPMARSRYQAARTIRGVFGRNNYNRTLESAVDPERQLEISRERRASLVPAEVLYSNNRSTVSHRVYEHYSEQRILCIGENQVNLRLCNEESYRSLRTSGLQHIHLGIFMIRLHALHRRDAGTKALVVFRDTRWEADSRQIIGTMEVDLSAGTQLVYMFPDMVLSNRSIMEETAGKLPSSVQSVISNDDLLTEILVRLPVLSLVLFKSVSKHWLSLIKGANVTFRQNLDPVSGLFLQKCSPYKKCYISYYYFLPLDIRIPICKSSLLATKFIFGHKSNEHVEILDSCNGLHLCSTFSGKFYVYNPSITNMFTALPEPNSVTCYNYGLKMAFDPTKSTHYKVIYGGPFKEWVRIHTYSSEKGNWSVCGHQFPMSCFIRFRCGVYWNDAIYWLNGEGKFFKLDIMIEHPVLTDLQTPLTFDRNECRLFESRGCLLLVGKDDSHSRHFTIYEKGNVHSEWSMKYIVNLDDIIKPFPEWWSIEEYIYCIVLGEREEDSFLVMQLDKKLVKYKIVSKTLSTISDLGPKEVRIKGCFQFIPSYANV